MIHVEVRLSEAEYRAAREEAARLGISLADLLRRSLRTLLPADPDKPWMRYAGMVTSGDPNSASTLDDHVHGLPD